MKSSMANVRFIVEETSTGYSAFTEENDGSIISSTGRDISELTDNLLESYNLWADYRKKPTITADQIQLQDATNE